MMSQLHVVDGGTTYGLPYNQLMLTVPDADAAAPELGGLRVLSIEGFCYSWDVYLASELAADQRGPQDRLPKSHRVAKACDA